MSQRTIFIAAAALTFAATAWAHHNMSAIYDFNDRITMTGTLSKIRRIAGTRRRIAVKTAYRIAATIVVVLLAALGAVAQLPTDPEERAKVIAQIMQANARQVTLFDREGKELNS